jgi:hypothetical protein
MGLFSQNNSRREEILGLSRSRGAVKNQVSDRITSCSEHFLAELKGPEAPPPQQKEKARLELHLVLASARARVRGQLIAHLAHLV